MYGNNGGNFTQGVAKNNGFSGGAKRQVSDAEKQLKAEKVTLEGILVFPKLAEPDTAIDGVLKWSIVLIMDKNLSPVNQKGLASAKRIIGGFKQIFFPGIPDQMFQMQGNPIKEFGVNFRQDGQPHPDFYNNSFWINAAMRKNPPQVVAKNGGQLVPLPLNSPEIYFGQKIAVTLSFYPMGLTNPQAKKGVGANLEAILILGGGERIGNDSSAPIDVDAAFAGFAADTAGMSQGSVATSGFMDNNFSGSNTQQTNTNPFANNGSGNGLI